MKILQLCKKFPFPLKDGESLAITYLSKALIDLGCDITLLAMNTKKHFFNVKKLPKNFNHYSSIHTVKIDNEVKPKDAFLNLFSEESYHISRFISDDFSKKLIRLLKSERFDVVQLETLYLAPYIPIIRKYSNAVVAMRAHNVEHEIWERITQNTKSFPKKWYLSHLTKKLKSFEINQLKNYDLMIPITDRDQRLFRKLGYKNTSIVTPIGIDVHNYIPNDACFDHDFSISFIGSLDWMPNIEGLQWFLENVWNKVLKKYPKLKLNIAGRNTPEWLFQNNYKNVKVLGEIPDAIKFINQHSVMIVPLLSGSGMRAKILEGMALGKVVISTQLGLEGINAKHKKEVLIANTVDDFINAVDFCHADKKRLRKIGSRARSFIAHEYDNIEVAKNLVASYKKVSTIVNFIEH